MGSRPSATARGLSPRERGTVIAHQQRVRRYGLSPRERGNRGRHLPYVTAEGSIPARAGEPGSRRTARTTTWVYPRASGGTQPTIAETRVREGLSPRERGNPVLLERGLM